MSIRYFLTLVIFFIAGVLSVLAYQNFQKDSTDAKTSFAQTNIANTESEEPTPTIEPTVEWIPLPTATPTSPSYTSTNTNSAKKFTILESKKISADKSTAETGETVNYNATLKNTGSKNKFLTHICFNHSGGVTFGCVLNLNIATGDEFNVNNSMMYKTPGTYSVWVTWSQDGTNFYRPQGVGTATVTVN